MWPDSEKDRVFYFGMIIVNFVIMKKIKIVIVLVLAISLGGCVVTKKKKCPTYSDVKKTDQKFVC